MVTLGLIALALFLLALRINVILLLLSATAYVHLVWGNGKLCYLVDDMWGSLNNEVLLAIPMFIAAGSIVIAPIAAAIRNRRLLRPGLARNADRPGCRTEFQSAAANSGQSRCRLASIRSDTRRAASCTESRARCA